MALDSFATRVAAAVVTLQRQQKGEGQQQPEEPSTADWMPMRARETRRIGRDDLAAPEAQPQFDGHQQGQQRHRMALLGRS